MRRVSYEGQCWQRVSTNRRKSPMNGHANLMIHLCALAMLVLAGCRDSTSAMPPGGNVASDEQILALEREIGMHHAAVNRIVTVNVVPGVPQARPSSDPNSLKWYIEPGKPVYPDMTQDLESHQAEIRRLRAEYDKFVESRQRAGLPIPRVPTCDACDGRGLDNGAHMEIGRTESGDLGPVFKSSGLHVCRKCDGTGLQPSPVSPPL